MKTFLSVALFLFAFKSTVNAQSSESIDNRNKLQIELKVGMNYSNLYNINSEFFDINAKSGYCGGIVAKVPITTLLGFQVGSSYSQKGFKARGSVEGSSFNLIRTLNYLDIPFLLDVKPNEYLSFLMGPQFSYLLSKKDRVYGEELSNETFKLLNEEPLRKTNFGFSGGIDINLNHFSMGARINFDLLHNNKKISVLPQNKNTWFQGTIGYSIYN